MLKNKIDLNLLITLNALLREKNVSKAAKILAISQSSASNALARLREIYNDPLLVRVGRSYDLSPLALQLVVPVQAASQDLNAIFSWRDQLDLSQEIKTIRIAARDYITSLLLPPLLIICIITTPQHFC
jgi:DNA-binding transcriptional LysR family regulator